MGACHFSQSRLIIVRAFGSGMRVVMSFRQAARCALRLASSLSSPHSVSASSTEPQVDMTIVTVGDAHGEPPFTAWQFASEKG